MTDVVDKSTRSRMISGIRGRDTTPEIRLRSLLHSAGLRYRLHVRKLPGCPDIVFPGLKSVILVQGCFWHRHSGCRWAATPSSNAKFRREKLGKNAERDRRNIAELKKLGWRVATVWECALRKLTDEQVLDSVGEWLKGDADRFDLSF